MPQSVELVLPPTIVNSRTFLSRQRRGKGDSKSPLVHSSFVHVSYPENLNSSYPGVPFGSQGPGLGYRYQC